jgi:murein DD-endopeptidase MepM/ murein hydrolase activator NlpD
MTSRRANLTVLAVGLALLALGLAWRYAAPAAPPSRSNDLIREYLLFPTRRAALSNTARTQCAGAPFILPSGGLIGLMYGDTAAPYTPARRHTGIDIFGDGPSGTVPVYAVYDGWLTRLADWRSTVIIRHDDPLQLGRTIWTYYTHMASRDGSQSFISAQFPPGTSEQFVRQGELLGYQGEFAGAGAPIAMHLHFSIIRSGADGQFLNEALLANTLDPSPYFGLRLRLEDEPQPRPLTCAFFNKT